MLISISVSIELKQKCNITRFDVLFAVSLLFSAYNNGSLFLALTPVSLEVLTISNGDMFCVRFEDVTLQFFLKTQDSCQQCFRYC